MDVLRGTYYSFNYRILCITGQWPYLSKSQKRIRTSLTLILILSLIIPLLLGLFKSTRGGDSTTIIESFSPLVGITFSLLQLLNLKIHNQQLAALLEKIQKDWEIWSMEAEIKILKEYAIKGKKFRVVYCAMIMTTVSSFFLAVLMPKILDWVKPLNESRPLSPIYITEYGVNSEKYYHSIFSHNFILTYLTLLIIVNGDMLFLACAQHATSICAAIGSKLSNLVSYQDYSFNQIDYFRKSVESDIIFCAKQHMDLLKYLKDFHSCFSSVYLIIVLFNMLIITMAGVTTVMNLHNSALAIKFMSENLGQMVHILCLTIPCEEMRDMSIRISDSVYMSNWYKLPVHCRKWLLMIMRVSTEPCEFVVGKLYTFSMKNFAEVMKTSFSFFTVLITIQ